MKASIDIGSNSVQFLIADDQKSYERMQFITSLGKDLDQNKVFLPQSMIDTQQAIRQCLSICQKYGISREDIVATATEASRVSQNADKFYGDLVSQHKITVYLLSPAGEAHYSAKGLLWNNPIDKDELVMMDIGGASTELVRLGVDPFSILDFHSFPIGSVRVSNWKEQDPGRFQKFFEDHRERLADFRTQKLYCVAGTTTSIANMVLGFSDYQDANVNGVLLKRDSVVNFEPSIRSLSISELKERFAFLGKRAEVIQGGFQLAIEIMNQLSVEQLEISTQGLNFGIIQGQLQDNFISKKYEP